MEELELKAENAGSFFPPSWVGAHSPPVTAAQSGVSRKLSTDT